MADKCHVHIKKLCYSVNKYFTKSCLLRLCRLRILLDGCKPAQGFYLIKVYLALRTCTWAREAGALEPPLAQSLLLAEMAVSFYIILSTSEPKIYLRPSILSYSLSHSIAPKFTKFNVRENLKLVPIRVLALPENFRTKEPGALGSITATTIATHHSWYP
ncbi:hypothetical protein EVAR_35687_1 [Eumeta japonica]|uniref:Uncharacterized protein n=1 Tax=Eumeta variegata TaxID=151549 RepID=A0A4C1VH10_EUMVA|nr:hypothetical protein EVAR_35687_1 [Eumeta japonica]